MLPWKRTWRFIVLATGTALTGFLLSADIPYRRPVYPSADPQAESVPATAPARPDIILLMRPADAVTLALADLRTIAPPVRCYVRYLWIPSGEVDAARVASLALNYVSRGSVIRRPDSVAAGHLLRVDLRWYAPRETDLREWISTWEEFSFDPTFSQLVTKDSLEFAQQLAVVAQPEVAGHPKRPVIRPRGTPVIDVVRQNAGHLPGTAMAELQAITHSQAPIVEHRYFLTRTLSTIRDKGVFAQVWGGLYYQLRGIKKSTTKGATDLDVFFDSLGVGNIKAGIKQEQVFENLRSDQRIALFRSDITGKPREVSMFHTLADREGGSFGAITGDIKDADVDVGDRSFANLLSPRRQAREAIFPGRTSLSIFALFNGAGELQDEVPPDVAVDATIPAPYTRRLQSAIGCIRCHQADGSDGWKPLTNDVKKLMAGRMDIFGDLSRGFGAFDTDTIDRLAGLYAGEFSKNLRRARDDVAEATLLATGSFDLKDSQAKIAKTAAQKMSDLYADYNYALVDAEKALRESGVDVPKAKSVEIFKRLMDLPTPDVNGVYLEKPAILAIASGIGVLRSDFSLVESEILSRVQANLLKVKP